MFGDTGTLTAATSRRDVGATQPVVFIMGVLHSGVAQPVFPSQEAAWPEDCQTLAADVIRH
jgi:hypothetical protein